MPVFAHFLDIVHLYTNHNNELQQILKLLYFFPRRKILISSSTQQIETFTSVLKPFQELTQELIFRYPVLLLLCQLFMPIK